MNHIMNDEIFKQNQFGEVYETRAIENSTMTFRRTLNLKA